MISIGLAIALSIPQATAPEMAARELGIPFDSANGYFEIVAASLIVSKHLAEVSGELAKPGGSRSRLQIRTETMTLCQEATVLLQVARTKTTHSPKDTVKFSLLNLAHFLDRIAIDQRMAVGDRRGASAFISDIVTLSSLSPGDSTLPKLVKQATERHLTRIPLAETESLIKKISSIPAHQELHILRAALLINRFRWHHNRFPLRLTDAGTWDNFTGTDGKPFLYQVIGTGFRLVDGDVQFRTQIPEDIK